MQTTVFKSGNSLAVRLLGTCRIPNGVRVRQWREGTRVVIEPLHEAWPDIAIEAAGSSTEELPRASKAFASHPADA